MRSPFNLWTYWISAATRAKIAVIVSQHLPSLQEQGSFSLGLTHGIGRLVIGQLLPDVQEMILMHARKQGDNYHHAALSFDLNDASIGSLLLKNWRFPAAVVNAVEQQYSPIEQMTPLTALGQIVHAIVDAGSMMRLPGDFDESDVGRLRKLLEHVHATSFEASKWQQERSQAYQQACSLIEGIRN